MAIYVCDTSCRVFSATNAVSFVFVAALVAVSEGRNDNFTYLNEILEVRAERGFGSLRLSLSSI